MTVTGSLAGNNGTLDFSQAAGSLITERISVGTGYLLSSSRVLGWSASGANGSLDTQLSRSSAGVVSVDTTSRGDGLGSLKAAAIALGQGSNTAQAIKYGGTGGIYGDGGAGTVFGASGSDQAKIDGVGIAIGGMFRWGASGTPGNPDTGLSRGAAGQVNVGNGTAGNATGTVQAANFQAASGVTNIGTVAGTNIVGGARDNGTSVSFGWQQATIAAASNGKLGFTSTTSNATSAPDTALSRAAAAVMALGNGTQGDKSGTLQLAGLQFTERTFATLPTASAANEGLEMMISDGPASPTYFAAASGGGSQPCKVVCVSSTWRFA
jgi:hypothetical protein